MRITPSISTTTKGKLPRLPFAVYKDAVLGKSYDLSIVFVGEKKIQMLNRDYRKIDKPTDILSFSLSKTSGEIFICLSETKKEAKKFDRTYANFLPFLLIHGLVHLAGYDHGTKMEILEKKYRSRFDI